MTNQAQPTATAPDAEAEADLASDRRMAAYRQEFYASPGYALFPREVIAAVRFCSVQTMEVEAIKGGGIPYRRIGRRAYYSKADYLDWIESQGQVVRNTAQLPQPKPRNVQTLTEATA